MVKRGDKVNVKYEKGGLLITMEAIAKSDGGIDDTVAVMNEQSKRVVSCIVTGEREVSVGGE